MVILFIIYFIIAIAFFAWLWYHPETDPDQLWDVPYLICAAIVWPVSITVMVMEYVVRD